MMCEISEQLPNRLLQALDTQRQLNALGIYFIPNQQEKVQFRRSAYYPFCAYSPEWVALQFKAQQDDAPTVECIDLDWSKQVLYESQVHQQQDWQARTLQQERYLAHNAYIKRFNGFLLKSA